MNQHIRHAIANLAAALGAHPNGLEARIDASVSACERAGLSEEQVIDACKIALSECEKFPTPSKLIGFIRSDNRALPPTVTRWEPGERPKWDSSFHSMTPAERKWHSDRDRAIWEVKRRNADRPINPSHFAPEGGLDIALKRFGFDSYGNDDPLQQVFFQEPHADPRSREEIMQEARTNFRLFTERTLVKNREARLKDETPF